MALKKYLQIACKGAYFFYLERISLYANNIFSNIFILFDIAFALQFLNI